MAKHPRFINDEQWKKIEPLLPKPKTGRVGRPSADNIEVLEGILWILRTGARCKDLPKRYPSASTCWRRLSRWEETSVWLKVWRKFLYVKGDIRNIGCPLSSLTTFRRIVRRSEIQL